MNTAAIAPEAATEPDLSPEAERRVARQFMGRIQWEAGADPGDEADWFGQERRSFIS